MFDKWRKYNYVAQKSERHRFMMICAGVLLFFLLYLCLTSLLFSMNVLENDAMQPTLHRGDRFIFSSYKIQSSLSGKLGNFSLKRGSIVLVDRGEKTGFLRAAADELLRFFTAQRLSLRDRQGNVYLKRIIGLPGDEITMSNFVIRVKPRGEAYSFTEFELTGQDDDVNIPRLPALWDETLPFSGDMETIVLSDDDCFVLSDDRGNTNDSRTWGPLPLELLSGGVAFRCWPLNRLGRP
jgi:signal peptidase I